MASEAVDSEVVTASDLNFEADDGLDNVDFTNEENDELMAINNQDNNGNEEEGTEAAVASIQLDDDLTEEVQGEDDYMLSTDGSFLPQPAENVPDVEVSLEDQLKSTEKLDRSSPDLWPQNLPTTAKQILIKNRLKTGEVDHAGSWAQGLDPEDINLLHQFGSLTSSSLVEEVKKLQNIAYTLGLDEKKELTRGKLLHVLD